jgi:hypothetical protein
MYYKVLMEGGHMGAGKSYDMTRYLQADSLISILDILKKMPRLKVKGFSRAVKEIAAVSREEFFRGKEREGRDNYLTQH